MRISDWSSDVCSSDLNQSLAESLTATGMATTYDESLRDYYGHNWQETQRRIEARFGRPLPADFRERHRERARAHFMQGLDAVPSAADFLARSEESSVGESGSVAVDLSGRRLNKKKTSQNI